MKKRIHLLSEGVVNQTWTITSATLDELIAAFAKRPAGTVPLLNATGSDRIIGWFQELERRGAQLWALVEVDAEAWLMLAALYRQVSACIQLDWTDPRTGEASGAMLVSASLCNYGLDIAGVLATAEDA